MAIHSTIPRETSREDTENRKGKERNLCKTLRGKRSKQDQAKEKGFVQEVQRANGASKIKHPKKKISLFFTYKWMVHCIS
jgi:hypothetical protein